jgi:hypothetical protein
VNNNHFKKIVNRNMPILFGIVSTVVSIAICFAKLAYYSNVATQTNLAVTIDADDHTVPNH